MPTELDAVNDGLSLVGQDRIAALDNTVNSKTIQTCKFFLPTVRTAVLRAHDWNCARRRKALATATNESLGEWSNAYRLPTDCLAVRRFVSLCPEIAYASFSVEGDSEGKPILYTNYGNNKIVYTTNLTDINRFDALLYQALCSGLAVKFAAVFPRDVVFMEKMLKLHQFNIDEGVGVAESEGGLERHTSNSIAEIR